MARIYLMLMRFIVVLTEGKLIAEDNKLCIIGLSRIQ